MQPSEFISKYSQSAIGSSAGTGIFPSVKMSQAILESAWAESTLTKEANNFFGIKDSSEWSGETIEMPTPYDASKTSFFRVYNSDVESFLDHTNFLLRNSRYKNAVVFNASSPEEQAQALKNAGYAEDADYVGKINSLISQYNLKSLDENMETSYGEYYGEGILPEITVSATPFNSTLIAAAIVVVCVFILIFW